MINTEVISKEVNYDRTGYLMFEDDKVYFDTSDEEYGPVIINLSLLESKLKEHKNKLNEQK